MTDIGPLADRLLLVRKRAKQTWRIAGVKITLAERRCETQKLMSRAMIPTSLLGKPAIVADI